MHKIIDGTSCNMEQIFADEFENMDNWVNLNPATEWKMGNGRLLGHWEKGGSDVWCKQEFSGDLYVEVTGALTEPDESWCRDFPPEGGKNFNIRFMVSGPNGGNIIDSYSDLLKTQTGLNKTGDDQYNGYFFTMCVPQNRMRRSPGYDNVSEYKNYPLDIGRTYTLKILKTGGRIRFFVGDKKLHDYIDPEPFNEGRIGIALWCSSVAVEKVKVFQLKEKDTP